MKHCPHWLAYISVKDCSHWLAFGHICEGLFALVGLWLSEGCPYWLAYFSVKDCPLWLACGHVSEGMVGRPYSLWVAPLPPELFDNEILRSAQARERVHIDSFLSSLNHSYDVTAVTGPCLDFHVTTTITWNSELKSALFPTQLFVRVFLS